MKSNVMEACANTHMHANAWKLGLLAWIKQL